MIDLQKIKALNHPHVEITLTKKGKLKEVKVWDMCYGVCKSDYCEGTYDPAQFLYDILKTYGLDVSMYREAERTKKRDVVFDREAREKWLKEVNRDHRGTEYD